MGVGVGLDVGLGVGFGVGVAVGAGVTAGVGSGAVVPPQAQRKSVAAARIAHMAFFISLYLQIFAVKYLHHY